MILKFKRVSKKFDRTNNLSVGIIAAILSTLFIAFPTIAPAFIFLGFTLFLMTTSPRAGIFNIITASVIAIGWSYFARAEYGYNQNITTVLGVSLFPVFAWTSGLLVNHILYLNFEHKFYRFFPKKNPIFRIIFFSLFYIILLLTIETIAYHVFDIHNETTANYPGLPICNCLHAPRWMQASYMLIGPIFFAISLIWDNGNPYNMKKIKKEPSPTIANDSSSI